MWRTALTLWFTITALLGGPGVCCCSFTSTLHSIATTLVGVDSPTTQGAEPIKSCCHQEAPPCGKHDEQNSAPGKPSECPCSNGKQAEILSVVEDANADLAERLKLPGTRLTGLPVVAFVYETGSISSPRRALYSGVFKPAGRDLLSVNSVLRC